MDYNGVVGLRAQRYILIQIPPPPPLPAREIAHLRFINRKVKCLAIYKLQSLNSCNL